MGSTARGTSFSCLLRTDLGLNSSGISAVFGKVDTLFPVVRSGNSHLKDLSPIENKYVSFN